MIDQSKFYNNYDFVKIVSQIPALQGLDACVRFPFQILGGRPNFFENAFSKVYFLREKYSQDSRIYMYNTRTRAYVRLNISTFKRLYRLFIADESKSESKMKEKKEIKPRQGKTRVQTRMCFGLNGNSIKRLKIKGRRNENSFPMKIFGDKGDCRKKFFRKDGSTPRGEKNGVFKGGVDFRKKFFEKIDFDITRISQIFRQKNLIF